MKRLTDNDLDALEAAYKAATPICGTRLTSHHIVNRGYEHLANLCRGDMGPIAMTYKEESDAIAAAHNALPALLAEVRELRRLTTPEPISEKHRDGNWWLVWAPGAEHWFKVRWRSAYGDWQKSGATDRLLNTPTHAVPLPGRPDA